MGLRYVEFWICVALQKLLHPAPRLTATEAPPAPKVMLCEKRNVP